MIKLVNVDNQAVEKNKRKYHDVYKGNGKIVITAEWNSEFGVGQEQSYLNKEDQFNTQIANYNKKGEDVNEGFDNIPLVSLDFGATSWLMGLAYGNKFITVNGLINAEPQIYEVNEAFEIKKLQHIQNYGIYPLITERIMQFQEAYPQIPITICDNQSPIDILTQIIHSEEAMIAMYEEKEPLHYLLDIITESVIEYNRFLEKTIKNFGGFQPGNYLPFGIHIADDDSAFLSPDFYEEFAKPYNERLSYEFGGLAHHCCMKQAQNLEIVASMKGFIGFDAMPDYNPIDKIIKAIENKGVWNVYNWPFAIREDRKEKTNDEMWFKNIVDKTEGKCGLILNVSDPAKEKALKLADTIRKYALKVGRLA